MPNLNLFQWAAIGVFVVIAAWPVLQSTGLSLWARIQSLNPSPSDDEHEDCDILETVVHLRSHFVDEPDVLDVIDKVLVPAAIRQMSEDA